jgi:hypothetical protein
MTYNDADKKITLSARGITNKPTTYKSRKPEFINHSNYNTVQFQITKSIGLFSAYQFTTSYTQSLLSWQPENTNY